MDYSLLVGIHDCTIPPEPDDDCVDSFGEEDGNGYISSDEVVDIPVSPTTGMFIISAPKTSRGKNCNLKFIIAIHVC